MEVIPYFPTVAEIRDWLELRIAGYTEAEAWRRIVTDIRPRDLARTLVRGAKGQPPLLLSVAIEGGSSTIKRGHPEKWRLSDHGRWSHIHLGALEAAYGSTPYYRYFIPEITEIINSAEAGDSFRDFTFKLFNCTTGLIFSQSVIESLRKLRAGRPDFFRSLIIEKKEEGIDDFAFIDVIFKKGPEAAFAVISE